MRLLCAAALTLTVGLFVAFGDDKDSPKGAERAKRLKELEKKYDDEFGRLVEKFQNAKTAEEKNAIRTEVRELSVLTAEKAIKIAEENPKDEVAFDAAVFIIQKLGRFAADQPEFAKAVGLIGDHHVNNPKVKDLLLTAGRFGPPGEKLLSAAAEKSTNKEVKGTALYMLGTMYAEQADDADDEKQATDLTDKAIKYLQMAAETAPDAKIGKDTIAEAAKTEITALKSLGIGSVAPDVTGIDLDGKKNKLSGFKGKVVMLDIWATWCPPCRAMIPHEREMVKKHKDKPFVLVSVSGDEEKEALTKFLEKEPMPWVHWWDGDEQKVLKTFRVKAFPTIYLIDHKGVIRKKWIGSPSNKVLDDAVEELVVAAERDAKK
ncbi:MAG TPA: TlpA disulfide reductase family protein [Gemmataceae bacterium]|nr:TlpA disulfide reductase family protein [Gemmataceae bacterium]